MDKNGDSLAMSWLRLIPFLLSEKIRVMDSTKNGHICLTNFRLIFYSKHQSHAISLPIYLIRRADASLGHLNITTKIGTTFVCSFNNVSTAESWAEKINSISEYPVDLNQMFAFSFRKALKEFDANHPFLQPVMNCLELSNNDTVLEAALVLHEFSRMEFSKHWKVTDVNSNFRICSSYPKYHIMPRNISDADIPLMAEFRSHNRFPSVVWRSKNTGAILLRCAQPCVGLMYYRNELDEQFVRAVLANCREDPKSKHRSEDSSGLLIVDARNWRTAQLNRFRGGGFEYVEYYDQSQIRFMNLPNLHYVRDSFERLVKLYDKPDTNWYSALETTKWLDYIGQLLKSASEVATALDTQGRPVMVHCTDGWDRTPQLTSLAQILLDPYYRTIQGFRILVEREWLQFGHKFADRGGHGEETSPIFLQWLDCVRQVQRQFPAYFEFNELFLIKLAIHTYSGLFGTFLCNSERERQATHLSTETCSVWSFLNAKRNWSLCNYLYEPKSEVIKPAYHVKNLDLWDSLYQNALLPCTIVNTSTASRSGDELCEGQQPAKQSEALTSFEGLPSPQPLELTLPASVVTSSGPPTHVSSCNNAVDRDQQFDDGAFFPDDLPRSQSLSTLSLNNYTVNDQFVVPKSSIEAPLAVPTSSTSEETSLIRPTLRSSCSLPWKRFEDGVPDEVGSGRLLQVSRSHSDLLFENCDQSQQQQVPSSLQISETPTIVTKSFSATNSSVEAKVDGPTNLRPFNSYQEIRDSRKSLHMRCFSDPESTYRLSISSLCDALLVDTQVVGTVNSENLCTEKCMNDGFDNAGEETASTTGTANVTAPHRSTQEGAGGGEDGDISPTLATAACTNRSSPNDSFNIPDENISLDNDVEAFYHGQNRDSKEITMNQYSSTADFVPWGNNYFTDPIFSNSFTNLNKEDAMRRDSGSSKGELDEESAGKGLDINMSRTKSAIAVPGNPLQQKLITRSKTMAGAPDVDNAEALLQLRHSTSLRFSSPPENLNQFLVDSSSRDAKPICPRWPSDFDALPMRIEPVTWRLHHRAEEERRSRNDLQTQIGILQRQQQDSQAMINSLLAEVARLRLSEASRNPTDASNSFCNGNHSSSSNSPPTNNNFTSLQNAVRVNGARRHAGPTTIEEALSEAMDQSFNRDAPSDYSENEILGSIIDGELKDPDGYDHLSPVYVPLLQCSKIPQQDFGRSLSFCSDVSSFEVVDLKEASDVNGTKICGSCSLAFNYQEPIKPCRNCNRAFCTSCSAWAYEGQVASQVPRLCKPCWYTFSRGSPSSAQIARFGVEPSVQLSYVPQVEQSSDALIFDDDLSSSPIGIHTQYVTSSTVSSHNCSTPDESSFCEGKRVSNSCRRSRYVMNNTPVSNSHSQNGIARA